MTEGEGEDLEKANTAEGGGVREGGSRESQEATSLCNNVYYHIAVSRS